MSRNVVTEKTERFDPVTGKPDPQFSVLLKEGDEFAAVLAEPRTHYHSPAEERAAAELRGTPGASQEIESLNILAEQLRASRNRIVNLIQRARRPTATEEPLFIGVSG